MSPNKSSINAGNAAQKIKVLRWRTYSVRMRRAMPMVRRNACERLSTIFTVHPGVDTAACEPKVDAGVSL